MPATQRVSVVEDSRALLQRLGIDTGAVHDGGLSVSSPIDGALLARLEQVDKVEAMEATLQHLQAHDELYA